MRTTHPTHTLFLVASSTGQSTSSSVPRRTATGARHSSSGAVVTRLAALRPAVGASPATAVLSRLLSLSPSGTRRILAGGSAGASSTHAAGSGHAALSLGWASPPQRRRRWPSRASQAGCVSDSAVAMASLEPSLADASRRCMLACLLQASASCSIWRSCEPRVGSATCTCAVGVGSASGEGSAARAERLASAAMSHASWRQAQSPSAAPSASRSTTSSAWAVRAADRCPASWTACSLQSEAHSSEVDGSAAPVDRAAAARASTLRKSRSSLQRARHWLLDGDIPRTERVELQEGGTGQDRIALERGGERTVTVT